MRSENCVYPPEGSLNPSRGILGSPKSEVQDSWGTGCGLTHAVSDGVQSGGCWCAFLPLICFLKKTSQKEPPNSPLPKQGHSMCSSALAASQTSDRYRHYKQTNTQTKPPATHQGRKGSQQEQHTQI